MKKFILWSLAVIITLVAGVYQKLTGPTYPQRVSVMVNNHKYDLRLTRSFSISETPGIYLAIKDTAVTVTLFYKRAKSGDEYQASMFSYHSEAGKEGYISVLPQQPVAGKLQYYFELKDSNGTQVFFKDNPVVVRFKGDVPPFVLVPHILLMFVAMLFSTLAGLMSAVKFPMYKKYAVWTFWLLLAGGMILGPVVQYFAFGEFWTGVPFGWDLTDNKTLIAFIFWIFAIFMNRKKERPVFVWIAAIVLLLVFSIPHSLFGSELNYATGQVTQGLILFSF